MKRAIKPVLYVALGIILGWVFRGSARPSYPSNWDEIRIGMSEAGATEIVPALQESGMRELKGFDQVAVDYGDCYWSLRITYDESLAVKSIEKAYVDREWGMLSKTLREPSD